MAFQETESNNTLATANVVSEIGSSFSAQLQAIGDSDYFRLALETGGVVSLAFTHPNGAGTTGKSVRVELRDANDNVIVGKTFTGNGTLNGTASAAGNYYIKVYDNDTSSYAWAEGLYSIVPSLETDPTFAYDSAINNTLATALTTLADGASPIVPGKTITGVLSANNDSDYFKLVLEKGGVVSLAFTHPNGPGTTGKGILVELRDANDNVIIGDTFTGNGTLTGTVSAAGNYYIKVYDNDGFSYAWAEGVYSIVPSFSTDPASAYDGAVNNTLSTALTTLADNTSPIVPDKTITGTLGAGSDSDYFKLVLDKGGVVSLAFTHPNGAGTTGLGIGIELRDANDNVIVSNTFKGNGTLTGTVAAAGNYYIKVYDNDGYSGSWAEGVYSLSLSTTLAAISFSPSDDELNVAVSSDIVITFSDEIQIGTGTIVLKKADDTVVEIYDVATSTNLSVSGATLTINPAADLSSSTEYKVDFDAGSIKDSAGNSYAGTTSYNFTTADIIAPTVVSFSPADETTGVAVYSNIVVTFSEAIQRGTGNITLKLADGTVVALYNATSSTNLSVSGSTLTINPAANLSSSTEYRVDFDAGSIKDSAGNSYTGTTSYNFTTVDTTAPTVTSFSPVNEATDVAVSSDIVITFSEKIQKGIGSIYLKRADGTIVAAYNVASSANLSVLDSILTINPTVDLVSNTGYRVELAAGTIKDMAGNSYTGTTSYNFTTAAPVDTEVPTVVVFYPTDNSTGIPLDNDIVVTFDEAIQRGIGDIILKKADGTVVATYNAATSANLKFSGSTLTIDPSSNFAAGTGYKVEFAAGTVKDLSDNSYAGTTSYNFTTAGITVNGTSTNDILQGSWGDDTISGGDGSDVFSVQGLPSQYTMVDTILAGIEGSDTLNSIEYIRFGAGLGADHFITDLTSFSLIDPDGSGPEASPAQKLLEQISDLYVAYFNRAPDVAGISYWFREVFNGSWTLDKIAASFTEQAEYLATYPPDMSNRDFIKTIYQNLFDRDPDAAGWDYWEGDLNGGAARDTFILAVINGAYAPSGGADDRALLNNKHDVSLYYTEQLLLYPLEGLDQNIDTVLNRVSSDPATVAKAMEVIDYIMEQPVSLTGLLQDVAAWENLWA